MLPTAFILCVLVPSFVNAYFLVGMRNVITQQRLDPIVSPGKVSAHAHAVVGGSNFGIVTNTSNLRQSTCTSNPIVQDKSAYWFPMLYFQWANGSFSSVSGGSVIYYLFDDKPGVTTAFPDDFRMISGTPNLRTYNASSYAQQAVSFLCLDFKGNSVRSTGFPQDPCASGVRAQINFPSCWDGKNVDSEDHQSHVAFRSTGPDSGDCSDPNFPVTLPRIFMEYYLDTVSWDKYRSQAMNPKQPYVYSMGDPTGYGYHADYMYGWDKGVLQKVVDQCHCDPFGDPDCCAKAGLFDLQPEGVQCHITDTVDEQTTGMLSKLPGNNPVQPAGTTAVTQPATSIPALLAPVYAYTGNNPPGQGKIVTPAQNNLPSTQPAPAPPTEAAAAPAKPEPVEPAPASNPASKSNSSNTTSPKTPKTCGRGYRKRRSLGREVVKRHLDSHIHARSRMQSHAF